MSESPRINGLDLSNLTLSELQELEHAVGERIRAVEEERREAGFQALEEVAREHGLTKKDVAARFSGKRKKGNGPAAPAKYRNPDDPTQTWTGRGRNPKWVKDLLADGTSVEDLAIR